MINFSRSLISLAVTSEEIGRIFSVLALFSSVGTSLVSGAWQKLYNLTLDTFPGAFFLLAAGMLIITIPVHLIMRRLVKSFKDTNENVISHLWIILNAHKISIIFVFLVWNWKTENLPNLKGRFWTKSKK